MTDLPSRPEPQSAETLSARPAPKPVRAPYAEGVPSPAVGFPDGPVLKPVSAADARAALAEGWRDFTRAPKYGLFFGAIFVIGGLFLFACLAVWDTPWAIIPPAIAFPLLGPFAAVGLYEVSRRLSKGEPLGWSEVLGVVVRQKDRQLGWMAFVMLFIFWIWAYQVRLLLAVFLSGESFSSLDGFVQTVLTTESGVGFLATGTVIGAVLYTVLFSLTVIGMPLLMDRDIDVVTATASSVAVVRRNPGVMIGWALLVAALTGIAMLPAFAGLLIVLPVLGHATWRLYERAVERDKTLDPGAAASP